MDSQTGAGQRCHVRLAGTKNFGKKPLVYSQANFYNSHLAPGSTATSFFLADTARPGRPSKEPGGITSGSSPKRERSAVFTGTWTLTDSCPEPQSPTSSCESSCGAWHSRPVGNAIPRHREQYSRISGNLLPKHLGTGYSAVYLERWM